VLARPLEVCTQMRKRIVPYVLAAHAAAVSPLAVAVAQATADDQPASPSATAAVVRVDYVKAPKRVVRHRGLRPWRHPSPRQVQLAIRSEARRWHIPAGAL